MPFTLRESLVACPDVVLLVVKKMCRKCVMATIWWRCSAIFAGCGGGPRVGRAVLMGVRAARLHNVVPRALGMAIVVATGDRRDLVLRDRDGLVHFVQRNTDDLDAELMTTD